MFNNGNTALKGGISRYDRLEGITIIQPLNQRNISFKTLQIIALPNDVYVLVLYGIAFRFLSFTFPPNGQVDLALLGDPRAASGGASLGWYAAYAKPGSTNGQPAAPQEVAPWRSE